MPPIAVLVALADPTRCRIIEILQQGPQPVHTLASSFDISRPAISRHLRVLKEAKLISEKKAGRENRYALHAARLKPVREWLDVVQATATRPEPKRVAAKATSAVAKPVAAPMAPQPPAPAPRATSQMGFDF
jgi:DNA-binding transcriptional ArsR family regulator